MPIISTIAAAAARGFGAFKSSVSQIVTTVDAFWSHVTLLLSGSSSGVSNSLPFVSDASTNKTVVTVNADARNSSFSPFNENYYSVYFDGAGDYLTIPSNTVLALGTGAFTFECWLNCSSVAVARVLFCTSNNSSGNGLLISIDATTGAPYVFSYQTGTRIITSLIGTTVNTWNHIAVVRNSSSSTTIYVNGVSGGSATDTSNYPSSQPTGIGATGDGASPIIGYISNLRLVKGTAVYTSNFTPSTTPLTAITNTSLLTCQSARFKDNSTNNFTISSVGDAKVSQIQPFSLPQTYLPYGSGYFDGTGDSLSWSGTTLSGDFTVECWVYKTAVDASGYTNVFSFSSANNQLAIDNTTVGSISLALNASVIITASGTAVTLNAWHHLAWVREGTTCRAYVNGVQQGTGTSSDSFTLNLIGQYQFGGYEMNGYISNVRIVSGTCLYPSGTTFTPSTIPLTAIANTRLLTLQSSYPLNNSVFLDDSVNNFTITRTGNATQGTFTPYENSYSTYFTGSDCKLQIADNSAFTLTADFTIECWFYATVTPTGISILINKWSSTGQEYVFEYGVRSGSNARQLRFFWGPFGTGTPLLTSGNNIFVISTWNHVAVTRSGSTFRMYVNGVEAATGTNTAAVTDTSEPLFIGNYSSDTIYGTVGYISDVRIVKGTALYTSNFTPPTSPLTAIPNTSLLTCQSNRFIDNSANRFTVSSSGTAVASISSYNPYQTLVASNTSNSVYFDGTGDNLSLATATTLGSGNTTVEFWFYPTDVSVTYRCLYDGRSTVGTDTGYGIFQYGRTIEVYGTTLIVASAATAFSVNTWVHVAVVRSSNSVQIYINGTASGSPAAYSNNLTSIIRRIGDSVNTLFPFVGFISNLRETTSAVYTANFTPSTSPLTVITNTSLLTCQSNTVIDNGPSRFPISQIGDAIPSRFSPFAITYSQRYYTPATFGGSAYFDGSGDYITVPHNSVLTPAGDFTIEFWAYPTNISSTREWYSKGYGIQLYSQTGSWGLALSSNNTGTYYVNASFGSMLLNQWQHVAVTRSGNSYTGFLNGIPTNLGTSSSAPNTGTDVLRIGEWAGGLGYPVLGYMSGIRYINGSAIYTGRFTPSAIPPTATGNTQLLVNAANAGIADSSMSSDSESVGDVKISNIQSKYYNTAMYFDGTGDFISQSISDAYQFGTNDFTIEMWIFTSNLSVYQTLIDARSGDGAIPYGLFIDNTGKLYWYDTSGTQLASTSITANTWTHIAVSRQSGTLRLYLNGVVVYQGSNTNSQNPTGTLFIGRNIGNSTLFTGYINDLRITKGVGRYGGNVASTSAFPTNNLDPYWNYVTMLLPGNGTNGAQNNTFTDSSINNFSITRNGNTTQGTFSPYGSNWSVFFSGASTNTGISLPTSSAFKFGTGDFCIEAFVFPTSYASGLVVLSTCDDIAGSLGLVFIINSSGFPAVFSFRSNSTILTGSGTSVPLNTWSHIAVSRSGTTLRVFVNGTEVGSTTNSEDFQGNSNGGGIGAYVVNPAAPFVGYISNMRVLKGSALYTGSYTVPTASLTAITNTVLLACQSNRLIDNSTNAFALANINTTNTVSVQRFSPFSSTDAYSASVIGGSGYFDGTGDYLTLPTGNLLLSNNDFSFEAWVYLTATPSTAAGIFYGQGDAASQSGSSYGFLVSSATTSDVYVGGATYGITSPNPSLNAWAHVAYVRTGGTFSSYLNGTRVGTRSDLAALTVNNGATTRAPTIGAVNGGTTYLITGYISNARAIIGSGGYNATSATITIPTSPLNAITNTRLLLNFTNAGIIDNAMINDLETIGNAQISTTQSKFGSASISIPNSSSYIKLSAPITLSYAEKWTVEFWVYPTTSFVPTAWYGGGSNQLAISDDSRNRFITFPSSFALAGDAKLVSATSAVSANTWGFVSVVCSGGVVTVYVNGGSSASASTTKNMEIVFLAYNNISGSWFDGYIDDFRVTKGIARFPSAFTPPTGPFISGNS